MPSSSLETSPADLFRDLSPEERERRLSDLAPEEAEALLYDWEWWARPSQMLPALDANPRTPDGSWTIWLAKAGRGWGKSRVGAETTRIWIRQGYRYVNLIGPTIDDARDIMIEGESGILACCPKPERPYYRISKRRLEWPSGAWSLIFTADEPERLRGKQHMKLWCLTGDAMVWMGDGSILRLDAVKPGDQVMTRRGSRMVLATACRFETVGEVKFSNGSILRGTREHSIFTKCGRMMLCQLSIGESALAATLVPTLARKVPKVSGETSTCTDGFGKPFMAPSLKALTFITSTTTSSTTILQTLNSENTGSIENLTQFKSLMAHFSKPKWWCALCVGWKCFEGGWISILDALRAIGNRLTKNVSQSGNASTVEQFLNQEEGTTVVSVVSTWAPAGQELVYDLTVDGEHEFFTNKILSHNCDELAAWRYPEAWDQASFGLRLGKSPQAIVTTTPRPTPLMKELLADPNVLVTHGRTLDNAHNLAKAFKDKIIRKYEGTRLGRQELDAEVLEDNPGALWKRKDIDEPRLVACPPLRRIVVGVDPAASHNADSDETGIVAGGIGFEDPPHFYVLDDASLSASPDNWAKAAVRTYLIQKADRLVGEVNNGGEMVEHTVRNVLLDGKPEGRNVAYKAVHASHGKAVRAEPVAALYEQHRVHHIGYLPKLEDQLCDWDPKESTDSPDRLDALVWTITELAGDLFGPIRINSGLLAKVRR